MIWYRIWTMTSFNYAVRVFFRNGFSDFQEHISFPIFPEKHDFFQDLICQISRNILLLPKFQNWMFQGHYFPISRNIIDFLQNPSTSLFSPGHFFSNFQERHSLFQISWLDQKRGKTGNGKRSGFNSSFPVFSHDLQFHR